ncbi:hypothetical protein N7456_001016 [Penicillium angulare]|uniref:AB hydrolase-1 domain-containing protein n=1 Tax=Penicillium angulare TaxID=116970 RepID=A0A9W9GD41_9EURO|nr:hypothetical protein N7456_001016 [Penicillium angulare]
MKFSTYAGPLVAALVYSCPVLAANSSDNEPTLQLSTDSAFNFQFLIALGNALTGGSDIDPVLGVAKNIKAGDMASYSKEFHKLARDTKAQAQNPENAYDPINVRDTWFSASHYFRRTDFYLHGNWSNPLINSLWAEQTAAFNKAIAALPVPGKRILIPAKEGNFTIEAIWFGAPNSENRTLPTLVVGNGYDAAQEDSYHYFVAKALERGWNCITYEGPGQPTVRRKQNIGFIPDWEKVVTPVMDYLLSEKADVVDKDQVVLIGNSMGGYLAARAAAFEKRLAAVVLVPGVWNLYASFTRQLPSQLMDMYDAGNFTQFDKELFSLRKSGKLSTNAAWGLDQGLWSFYTHSPSDFLTQSKQFQLEDVVDKIDMPVFVGDGEYDDLTPGQAITVAKALGNKATLYQFNGTSGYHCQTGALQDLTRTMFAWIHKTLANA